MAIKRDDRYPGRWSPADADYPLGGPKNRTTPSAKDGSYFEKDWIADYEAFFGKLISDAGITPSGDPDTAQLSQFHDAFIAALSVENRLKSNQNFNVEGADGHISATPQTFTVGQEFAKGRFVAGSDLVNATYTGGLINADSGSYYVEYEGDFTNDFYGIKLADDSIVQTGVNISLATGNTRITVDMSTAPAHKFAGLSGSVGVWPDINDVDSSATSGGDTAKRIENNNGAAAFDANGALWQTDDLANASATVGGTGWTRQLQAAIIYPAGTITSGGLISVNLTDIDPALVGKQIAFRVEINAQGVWSETGRYSVSYQNSGGHFVNGVQVGDLIEIRGGSIGLTFNNPFFTGATFTTYLTTAPCRLVITGAN